MKSEGIVEHKEDSESRKPTPLEDRNKHNSSAQSVSVKQSIDAVNDAVSNIEGLTMANRRPIRRLQKAAAPVNNTAALKSIGGAPESKASSYVPSAIGAGSKRAAGRAEIADPFAKFDNEYETFAPPKNASSNAGSAQPVY